MSAQSTSRPLAVVAGLKNKLQAAAANITPAGVLAEQHRRMAAPGSGNNKPNPH